MAAEYVLKEGNENVMLCERGIRTFETAYRFTLDLTAVPVLKELTHLPVIVDPSHAAGRRDLVEPLSLAAAAVGRRRHHRRGAPAARGGDLRRAAGARRRRLRRYAEQVEAAAAVAGKALSTPRSEQRDRRDPRRRADRRLGRARRARAPRAPDVAASTRRRACSTRALARGALDARARTPAEALDGAEAAFVAAPVERAARPRCATCWRPPRAATAS